MTMACQTTNAAESEHSQTTAAGISLAEFPSSAADFVSPITHVSQRNKPLGLKPFHSCPRRGVHSHAADVLLHEGNLVFHAEKYAAQIDADEPPANT
jgi:hypothetical protein